MPEKGVFTITEIVLLSIVWTSCQFVWTNVLRTGLTDALGLLSLGKYATDVLVATILLAATFALIFLFKNVQVGSSTLFFLNDDAPGISFPIGKKKPPEDGGLPPGVFAPPAATAAAAEAFEPESMSLVA